MSADVEGARDQFEDRWVLLAYSLVYTLAESGTESQNWVTNIN